MLASTSEIRREKRHCTVLSSTSNYDTLLPILLHGYQPWRRGKDNINLLFSVMCVCSRKLKLATCINYADLNNSMLRMRGHVSTRFFRCDVLFLQGKHSGFCHCKCIK